LNLKLIAELAPTGTLEEDTVATIARLMWRKQNLGTVRVAELTRSRYVEIRSAKLPDNILRMLDDADLAKLIEATQAAEDQAREEFGDRYKLLEIGEAATFAGLRQDLDIQERLDAMIDKCLKRLLYLRGLKSMSTVSSSATQQRIAGPTRAA
jgi:hypothetical protein